MQICPVDGMRSGPALWRTVLRRVDALELPGHVERILKKERHRRGERGERLAVIAIGAEEHIVRVESEERPGKRHHAEEVDDAKLEKVAPDVLHDEQ